MQLIYETLRYHVMLQVLFFYNPLHIHLKFGKVPRVIMQYLKFFDIIYDIYRGCFNS